MSSNSNEINIENRTQASSEMQHEEAKDIEKINNVRIKADNIARSISNIRIENNDVASKKRDIAKTEKKSDIYLKEKKIRDSKRQVTKTRLVQLAVERTMLETSLAKNMQATESAKQELKK